MLPNVACTAGTTPLIMWLSQELYYIQDKALSSSFCNAFPELAQLALWRIISNYNSIIVILKLMFSKRRSTIYVF